MKKILTIAASLTLAVLASAQTYVLDNFNNGTQTGAVDPTTSWNGNVSLVTTPGALTVGGTATDQSGWGYNFASPVDLSAFNNKYVEIIAQRSPSNVAANLLITFADDSGSGFQTLSVSTSLFSTSSLTTVVIPLVWTIDSTIIAAWNIGGGNAASGGPAFAMTFGNLALTSSAAAIPEPSTYAAIFGALALGFVAYRRRAARVA